MGIVPRGTTSMAEQERNRRVVLTGAADDVLFNLSSTDLITL